MNASHTEELPQGWTYTSIREVRLSNVDQGGPTGGGNFVYVDISSIDNKTKRIAEPKVLSVQEAPSRARQQLEPYDVLVSMTRPNLNAVALVPANLKGSIGSTGFHVLRPHLIAPGWLLFLVQTNAFVEAMSLLVQGALYPAVRPKDIDSYPIPLAPVPEQYRIVAEIEKQFTRLDAAVAAFKRIQANLKRYRASVLKAACEGGLVPTEAELARREGRSYETGVELLDRLSNKTPSDARAQRKERGQPDGLVPPLPPLPEGWTRSRVGDILKIRSGYAFKSDEYREMGAPLIRQADLVGATVDVSKAKRLPEAFLGEFKHYTVRSGDLLIGMSGSLGKVSEYRESCPGLQNQRTGLLLVDDEIPRGFARLVIEYVAPQIHAVGKGIAVQNVSAAEIEACGFLLPPISEQRRIVGEVECRFSMLDQLRGVVDSNLRRAERLRQAILKRAFEGKLVSQDPNDEYASALLERIRAEREKAGVGDGTRKPRVLRRRGMAAEPSVRR